MEPRCCATPSVYYGNLNMHYICGKCGMLWHRKPEWASKKLPWVGAIGTNHYGPEDADYDTEGRPLAASQEVG